MTQTSQFMIGAAVSCSDGACGEVTRVVIDPVADTVTHLVVEPAHHRGPARLVGLDLLEAATPSEIRLRCPLADFDQLDPAQETHFLPVSTRYGGSYHGYALNQAFVWPYYGLGAGMGMGLGAGGLSLGMGTGMGMVSVPQPVTSDTLPLGEVTIRRGEPVQATDGEIGHVQGLVIAATSHHVTHVLLQEGHLWGRKQVAIPISAVTKINDGIQLTISKEQVEKLPPVDLNPPPE